MTGLGKGMAVGIGLLIGLSLAAPASAGTGPSWKLLGEKEGIRAYSREVEGSPLREGLAEGIVEADPSTVLSIITDYDRYREFMPYVSECRVLREAGDKSWVYQYLDMPWPIANRFYTIEIATALRDPEGGRYRVEWRLADPEDSARAPSKGVAVVRNAGYWDLSPAGIGRGTKVVYGVHTDPGGKIPNLLVNSTTKSALLGVVRAVKGRAERAR